MTSPRKKTDPPTRGLGAIRRDEGYPLDFFKSISGLKVAAIRSMKKRGLKIRRIGENGGGQAFILGSDFLDFLASIKD